VAVLLGQRTVSQVVATVAVAATALDVMASRPTMSPVWHLMTARLICQLLNSRSCGLSWPYSGLAVCCAPPARPEAS
jgi:hypothetical protein